ncbi:MAG: hypothetical protein AB7T49_03905 [Oligoflexales bacterium]
MLRVSVNAILISSAMLLALSCKKSGSKVKDLGDTGRQSCDEITYMFESSLDEYFYAYQELQKASCTLITKRMTAPKKGLKLRSAQDRNEADVAFPALAKASASDGLLRTETFDGLKLAGGEEKETPTGSEKKEPEAVVVTPACIKLERYAIDLNRYIRKAIDSYSACVTTEYGASKTKIVDYPGCTSPCLLGEKDCYKCNAIANGPEGDNGTITCSTKNDAAFQVGRWCNIYTPGKCNLTFTGDAVGLNGIACAKLDHAPVAMGQTLSGTSEETVLTTNTATSFTPLDLSLKIGYDFEIPLILKGGVTAKQTTKYNMSTNSVQGLQFLSRAGFPFAFEDARVTNTSKSCISPIEVSTQSWVKPNAKEVCNVIGSAGNEYWCVLQKIDVKATTIGGGINANVKVVAFGAENNTTGEMSWGSNTMAIGKGGLFRGSGKPIREIQAQCRHWLKNYVYMAMSTASVVNNAVVSYPEVEIKIGEPRVKCTYKNAKNTEIKDFFIFVKKDTMEVQYRRHTDLLSGFAEKPLIYILTHGEVPGKFAKNIKGKTFQPAEIAAFLNEAVKTKSAASGEWGINSCTAF